jgi:GDP-L-fucose synthase
MNLPHETYQSQVQTQLSLINVGYGSDVTITELAQTVATVVGFGGRIVFDPTMPDGAPRKLMNSQRLNALGWHARISLVQGLKLAYKDFLTLAKH